MVFLSHVKNCSHFFFRKDVRDFFGVEYLHCKTACICISLTFYSTFIIHIQYNISMFNFFILAVKNDSDILSLSLLF